MLKVVVFLTLILLLFPLVSAQQPGQGQPRAPPNFFQGILDSLNELVDVMRNILFEVEEISDKNSTININLPDTECEFQEFNFEKDVDIFISQEFIGSGAIMTRYYDFFREDEVLNGEFNLLVATGNPIFVTANALIVKSGQVSEEPIGPGHNWRFLGDEGTNLASGPEKSLNFWFRGSSVETDLGTILSTTPPPGEGFYIRHHLGNIEIFNLFAEGTSGIPLTNNVWYMVTIVRVGGSASFYFNGELASTGDIILQNSIFNYSIGYTPTDGGSEFIGLFDEMSFWSDALTQSDIDLLYNGGQGRVSSELNGVMQITETSDKILIPQEFEYSNFSVIEADIDALCVGNCSYSINGADCGFIEDGFNDLPQECLEAIVGGFNTIGFEVDTASHGEISNLRLNSLVKPANC